MSYRKLLLLALFAFPALLCSQIPQVIKIWDSAPHNAFTDLIRYNQFFYCTFREGVNHVPKDITQNGKIRILRSRSGREWESVALLSNSRYDLRDPKISITPGNKLMIIMGGSNYETGKLTGMLPHVSFSEDGLYFSVPVPVLIEEKVKTPFDWIWRVSWNGITGFAVVYQPRQPDNSNKIRLVRTQDGINWQQITDFDLSSLPNEATIKLDKSNRMFILLRREANANGMLGESIPPYANWNWTELGYRLGGPNFIIMKNNKLCIGTRKYNPDGAKTVIYITDMKGVIELTIELPSGGDTSYPGMILYKGRLWISYYSSHEGKTSVYLACLKLKDITGL